MSKQRQLAAIVFSDVSGYTSIMDKDESKALNIIDQFRTTVHNLIEDYRGKHLKDMGDGHLLMFPSAKDAVEFSLSLNKKINEEEKYAISSGIHLGDVVIEENDVFGSGVNISSRIQNLANKGEIVISDAVYKEVKNKSQYDIISQGKKSVKGIDESINIHQIFYKGSKDIDIKKKDLSRSFIAMLFERRMPQFIGVYAAICWTIIQFLDWIVDRYLLSPYLVDLGLGITLSMIPSVLILSYFHGKPGKDKWTHIEKIGIPLNVFSSILILFIFFYPKDLRAVTKNVTVTDIDGNEITQTIVKSEFRKSFVIYQFNNTSKDSTYNWLGAGIKRALRTDLLQEIFCNSRNRRAQKIKEDMGFKRSEHLSLGDKQKIAKRTLSEYFVSGNFIVEENLYTINVDLYLTKNAKKVNSSKYQGNDFFSLIDLASKQIKIDMEIPLPYIENTTDLPVNERLTDSMEALKHFIYSSHINENEESMYHMKKAVEYDKEFALAHVYLYDNYNLNNNEEKFKEHMSLALKYLNKLNEGMRFAVRMDEQITIDKRIQILNMWEKLYPEDLEPCYIAVQLYSFDSNFDKVIHYYNKILTIAPEEHQVLLKLGTIYSHIYEYEKSLAYFNRYIEMYPKNPEGYEKIASVYQLQLDYGKSQEFMLKAQTLGASGPEFDVKMAKINSKLYKWSADKFADEIYIIIDKYPPSFNIILIYPEIYFRYQSEGKYRASLKSQDEMIEFASLLAGPVFAALMSTDRLSTLAELGEGDQLEAKLNEALADIKMPPWNAMSNFLRCCFYFSTKNWDAFNKNIDAAMQGANDIGMGQLAIFGSEMRGGYFEAIEDYPSAIEQYNIVIETPTSLGDVHHNYANAHLYKGRVYQILKEYDKSEKMFEIALKKMDENAELFYEYSILKEKQGKMDDAKSLIMKAYNLYKEADKELELTQKIFDRYEQFKDQFN